VQWGQRVALIEIVDRQYGHSFVVGSAGSSSSFRSSRLIWRTIKKIAKATMTKSITVLMNNP
jgi:hypothetical protein